VRRELATRPTGLGGQSADLPTAALATGTKVTFVLDGEGAAGRGLTEYCVEIT
jgi:hypothetical protein